MLLFEKEMSPNIIENILLTMIKYQNKQFSKRKVSTNSGNIQK
jgi:hypothetical protein